MSGPARANEMRRMLDTRSRRVQVATDLQTLGFNLLPILRGEERPPGAWSGWQFTRQSLEDVLALNWGDRVGGIGAVCGDVSDSGACLCIDKADGPQILREILEALGLPETYPWAVRIPGGGYHVWVRSPGTAASLNHTLARRTIELPTGRQKQRR